MKDLRSFIINNISTKENPKDWSMMFMVTRMILVIYNFFFSRKKNLITKFLSYNEIDATNGNLRIISVQDLSFVVSDHQSGDACGGANKKKTINLFTVYINFCFLLSLN